MIVKINRFMSQLSFTPKWTRDDNGMDFTRMRAKVTKLAWNAAGGAWLQVRQLIIKETKEVSQKEFSRSKFANHKVKRLDGTQQSRKSSDSEISVG